MFYEDTHTQCMHLFMYACGHTYTHIWLPKLTCLIDALFSLSDYLDTMHKTCIGYNTYKGL